MNMKEELEDFVQKHRKAFDEHEIDKEAMWTKIDNELSISGPKKISLLIKATWPLAASVVVLLGGMLLFYGLSNDISENNLVTQELSEVDTYYGALINSQVDLINNRMDLSSEERDDFLSLLDELDLEYQRLRKELDEGINNRKIMKAIVNNYRKKIQLMEKFIEKSYPIENESDETEYIL